MKRRWFAPEIIQTSAMDCGPASLKCLLEGHFIDIDYGRLRDLCQTDLDGTSIDVMEAVAVQLGLPAEQIITPLDHLPLDSANTLPAILIVRLPSGTTHFVVLWRRVGNWFQVMDPAVGRRWLHRDYIQENAYLHTSTVTASAWREWAGTPEFTRPLTDRLLRLGLNTGSALHLVQTARDDTHWYSLAALDAATRLVQDLRQAGGIQRGEQTRHTLQILFEQSRAALPHGDHGPIPNQYWSALAFPGTVAADELVMKGVILVRVPATAVAPAPTAPQRLQALQAAPLRPAQQLLQLLRTEGLLAPFALTFLAALSAAGLILEAILFRVLLDLGQFLRLPPQRTVALLALQALLLILLWLDYTTLHGVWRIGRALEIRLRLALAEKLPRLHDAFFHSRLVSDLAERSHSVYKLRFLSQLGGEWVTAVFTLLFTAAGLIWLSPHNLAAILLLTFTTLSLPILAQTVLVERELRVRTHLGALSLYYLDALIGLLPARAARAEAAIQRGHHALLLKWQNARLDLQRASVFLEGVQISLIMGLVVYLLFSFFNSHPNGSLLLLVYWLLSLPGIGQQIAALAQEYPTQRNIALRLLEPLTAAEEPPAEALDTTGPTAVTLDHVTVHSGGHTILHDITLALPAGQTLALVGASGAGKSTLMGLLLGWHTPASGTLTLNGRSLTPAALAGLRRHTAWVDPTVHIWNHSFLDNLHYGHTPPHRLPFSQLLSQADLLQVLERLPDGGQNPLGEGGGLLSGGEGQRVRLGRALLKREVHLVLLDEPFRGLDRPQRQELLRRARRLWQGVTLVCITHDVGDTADFDQVAVLDHGHLLEVDEPAALQANPDSAYARLLAAETAVRQTLWQAAQWRRVRLVDGKLVEAQRNA